MPVRTPYAHEHCCCRIEGKLPRGVKLASSLPRAVVRGFYQYLNLRASICYTLGRRGQSREHESVRRVLQSKRGRSVGRSKTSNKAGLRKIVYDNSRYGVVIEVETITLLVHNNMQ